MLELIVFALCATVVVGVFMLLKIWCVYNIQHTAIWNLHELRHAYSFDMMLFHPHWWLIFTYNQAVKFYEKEKENV